MRASTKKKCFCCGAATQDKETTQIKMNEFKKNQRRFDKINDLIIGKNIEFLEMRRRYFITKSDIENFAAQFNGVIEEQIIQNNRAVEKNLKSYFRELNQKQQKFDKIKKTCINLHNTLQDYLRERAALEKMVLDDIRVVCITRKELAAPCTEVCGVCLETHKMKYMIKTDCGHNYCAPCFTQWTNTSKKLSCPHCRAAVSRVDIYKTAQYGRPRAAAAAAPMNKNIV